MEQGAGDNGTRIKETRIHGTSEQGTREQPLSKQDISLQETDKQHIVAQDANKQVADVQEVIPEKPDFKILLQALSETEDNYLFFTNVKTLLTAVLQHTLAATEQEEMSVLLLLEEKNAALADEAKHIYAACNQYLYSPVIDDNARTALIVQLDHVIRQVETV